VRLTVFKYVLENSVNFGLAAERHSLTINFMEEIEGYILVGGKNSRMKQVKANLKFDGKTFVELAAAALSGVSSQLFVVGNLHENPTELPILPDIFCGANTVQKHGAIIGLQTALKNTNTTWAAILACDLPFVSSELFEKISLYCEEEFDAIIPRQPDGRPQPLCAFYRAEKCLPVVDVMLRGSDWSLQNLLRQIRCCFIDFEEISDLPNSETFFLNVNTPEDYAKAKSLALNLR
jgi:molybdenum cofactor guanylyltransferase